MPNERLEPLSVTNERVLWTSRHSSPFTSWLPLPHGICGFLKLVRTPPSEEAKYPAVGSWLNRLVHPHSGLRGHVTEHVDTVGADLKTSPGRVKHNAEQCVWCPPCDTSRERGDEIQI